MINKCFLEITNICNLSCLFCPKNGRKKQMMTMEEFDRLTDSLKGEIRFLYFHLMGEPMLHPHLPDFITLAKSKGFIPILTTNGTLLKDANRLIESVPYKIQISVHSQEGNGKCDLVDYIDDVMRFSLNAADKGSIVVLRLWNQGGYEKENEQVVKLLEKYCPKPWSERYDGWKLIKNLYLENNTMFEWPEDNKEDFKDQNIFCYGLRDQIGVLVDGQVVPCCMDHEGVLSLGNLHEQSLQEILKSERAVKIYEGFSHHEAVESLCRKCGFVRRRLGN